MKIQNATTLDGLDRHYIAIALLTEIQSCWKFRHAHAIFRENVRAYCLALRKIRNAYTNFKLNED